MKQATIERRIHFSVNQAALPPDMIRFRDDLARGYGAYPQLASLPIGEVRRIAERVRAPWAAGGPAMWHTAEHVAMRDGMSLRLRLHVPSATPRGVLVYAHGGGWTIFSLNTHDRVMREYAARADALVVGLDYSLVPEARFPRQVDEMTSTLRLLRAPSAELLAATCGVDPGALPLAAAGDSAGGNLALAAAIALRDAGEAGLLASLVLNYAVLDARLDQPSFREFDGPDFNLSSNEMRIFWENYIPDVATRADPRASPLRARLDGLPPTFIAIAECDVLQGENLALGRALEAAGVPSRAILYPGMLHSFLEAVSISKTSARAFDDGAAWLREAWERTGAV